MSEEQNKALITVLEGQRNAAMNEVVNVRVALMLANAELQRIRESSMQNVAQGTQEGLRAVPA